jgi:hypothetical protein
MDADQYFGLGTWRRLVSRESTDARDKVFAFHGCFTPEVRQQISVDYGTSLEDIVTEMMRALYQTPYP